MKSRTLLMFVTAITLFAALAAAAQEQQMLTSLKQYTATDLGTLGATFNLNHHALLWENGTVIDLGNLGGMTPNAAGDNNVHARRAWRELGNRRRDDEPADTAATFRPLQVNGRRRDVQLHLGRQRYGPRGQSR